MPNIGEVLRRRSLLGFGGTRDRVLSSLCKLGYHHWPKVGSLKDFSALSVFQLFLPFATKGGVFSQHLSFLAKLYRLDDQKLPPVGLKIRICSARQNGSNGLTSWVEWTHRQQNTFKTIRCQTLGLVFVGL